MKATGTQLRNQGMERAELNANHKHESWSEQTYSFLLVFARKHTEFMTEQVRKAAKGIVPEPPIARAWGAIVARAAKAKIIQRAGFRAVSNPKAHRTPATVWEVV